MPLFLFTSIACPQFLFIHLVHHSDAAMHCLPLDPPSFACCLYPTRPSAGGLAPTPRHYCYMLLAPVPCWRLAPTPHCYTHLHHATTCYCYTGLLHTTHACTANLRHAGDWHRHHATTCYMLPLDTTHCCYMLHTTATCYTLLLHTLAPCCYPPLLHATRACTANPHHTATLYCYPSICALSMRHFQQATNRH
jgi:hypothetical protein